MNVVTRVQCTIGANNNTRLVSDSVKSESNYSNLVREFGDDNVGQVVPVDKYVPFHSSLLCIKLP